MPLPPSLWLRIGSGVLTALGVKEVVGDWFGVGKPANPYGHSVSGAAASAVSAVGKATVVVVAGVGVVAAIALAKQQRRR